MSHVALPFYIYVYILTRGELVINGVVNNSTAFCSTLMTTMFTMQATDDLFELQCSTHFSLKFYPADGGPLASASQHCFVPWFFHHNVRSFFLALNHVQYPPVDVK